MPDAVGPNVPAVSGATTQGTPTQGAPAPAEPVVFVSSSDRLYHRSGCEYLGKKKVATPISEAKGKGYSAYVVAPDGPDGGLFNVRVGTYPARTDAERTQAKLRDEEKYKPFIVRN